MVTIIPKNKCFIFSTPICIIRGEEGGKMKPIKKRKNYYVI